jgi:hypothetical protein
MLIFLYPAFGRCLASLASHTCAFESLLSITCPVDKTLFLQGFGAYYGCYALI